MPLRTRLIVNMLFISLITAVSVGGIAYLKLKRDFLSVTLELAFQDFQQDVVAYLNRYGSWEKGQHVEPFPAFARRVHFLQGFPEAGSADNAIRGSSGTPLADGDGSQPENTITSDRTPPFMFLLIDLQGRVLHGAGHYLNGDLVDERLRLTGRPISANGRVEVLAIPPVGTPQLNIR
ncbi:hypothetical protein RP726_16995 [Candidatus Methylospira mobilis]|nr:hypothetical protein [Candidatus Methylospira mobilis]WNV04091.1 hypothetical protein RP726_16995 [Candidatus Methylospira mobilis]